MDDLDMLREALDDLHIAIRDASRQLAEYVRDHGDDPVAYQLADRIMVALSNERRYRRMLATEIAG